MLSKQKADTKALKLKEKLKQFACLTGCIEGVSFLLILVFTF